jgi:ribosomal protein S4
MPISYKKNLLSWLVSHSYSYATAKQLLEERRVAVNGHLNQDPTALIEVHDRVVIKNECWGPKEKTDE